MLELHKNFDPVPQLPISGHANGRGVQQVCKLS
jgi:hypothetical protein